MDVKVGILVVFLLFGSWACDARPATHSDSSGVTKKVDVCSLCEEYSSLVLNYLTENRTQADIIEALHLACSELLLLEKECITLVDHYFTEFFTQLSTVEPDQFCEKAKLCKGEGILSPVGKENSCDACHHVVDEMILKLKDPETKFDVVEVLLRGCNAVENHWRKVKKCKSMVHRYAPIILAKAEKYLEKTDLCAAFHVCSPASAFDAKIMMVTSS